MDINFRLFDLMGKQLTENGLSKKDATSKKNYKDGLSGAEFLKLDKNNDGILTEEEFLLSGNKKELFEQYCKSAMNLNLDLDLSAWGIDQLKMSDINISKTSYDKNGNMIVRFEYDGKMFQATEASSLLNKKHTFNVVEIKSSNGIGTDPKNSIYTTVNKNGQITSLQDGGKNAQIADISVIKYKKDGRIYSLTSGDVSYINNASTTKPDADGTKTYTLVPSGSNKDKANFSQIQVSVKADGSYTFTYYKNQTVNGKQKSFKAKAINVGADGVPTDIITYKFNKETGKNEYSKCQYLNEDRVRTFTTDENGKITESTDRTQDGNLLSTQTYKQVDGHRVWSSRTVYDGTTKEADETHVIEYRKYSYDKDSEGNNTKTTKSWSNKADKDAGKDPNTTTRTYTNQEGELVKAITVESNPYKRTKTEYMNGQPILVEIKDSKDGDPVSTTKYDYNDDNTLNNITVYDADGNKVSEDTYTNGKLSHHADFKDGKYTYTEVYADDGKTVVIETKYDDLGRPVDERYYPGWDGKEEPKHNYYYDYTFSRTITYDEEGNSVSTEYHRYSSGPVISTYANAEGKIISEFKYRRYNDIDSITINFEGDLSDINLSDINIYDYVPAKLATQVRYACCSSYGLRIMSKDDNALDYKLISVWGGHQTLHDVDLKIPGYPNGLVIVKDEGREVGASYDDDGNLMKLIATEFDSTTGEVSAKETMEIDDQGRVVKRISDNISAGYSYTSTYTYDEDGNYTTERRDNETGKLIEKSKTTITDNDIHVTESVYYGYYDQDGKFVEEEPENSKDVIHYIKKGIFYYMPQYKETYDKDGNLAFKFYYDEEGKETECQDYENNRIYYYTNSEDGKESTTVMTDLEGNLLSTTKSKTDEDGETLVTEYNSMDEMQHITYYDQNNNLLTKIICEEDEDEDYNSVRNYKMIINTSDDSLSYDKFKQYIIRKVDIEMNGICEMYIYNNDGTRIAEIAYKNGKYFWLSSGWLAIEY